MGYQDETCSRMEQHRSCVTLTKCCTFPKPQIPYMEDWNSSCILIKMLQHELTHTDTMLVTMATLQHHSCPI